MKISFLSPVSSVNFGGVERYAVNLLSELAGMVGSHECRLVNFPPEIAERVSFRSVVMQYRFRDLFSQFLSRSAKRLTRDTIEYVAIGGLPFHIRRYAASYLRHV